MSHEEKYLSTLSEGEVAHRYHHHHTGLTVYGEDGDQQDYDWPYQMGVKAVGVHYVGVADGKGSLKDGWTRATPERKRWEPN